MDNRILAIIEKIKSLEAELTEELQRKQQEFYYEIKKRRVIFEGRIKAQHKLLMQGLLGYIFGAELKHILTIPVIWGVLPFIGAIDAAMSFYQAVCFPVFGIPKVKRSEYIVIDRQYLCYLNMIEKANLRLCQRAVCLYSVDPCAHGAVLVPNQARAQADGHAFEVREIPRIRRCRGLQGKI